MNQKEILEILAIVRSSHQRCSVTKGVLSNVAKFTGKRLCQSLFFNKVASLSPATLLKKRLWHSRFPVTFAKFLRTTFFIYNTYGRLLLSSKSDDEEEGPEYKVKRVSNSEWCVRSAKAAFGRCSSN